MEPFGATVGAVDRRLVPGRDIRCRTRVEAVDALQHFRVDAGQVVAFGLVEFVDASDLAVRHDVDFDRPAGREGHEGGEVIGFEDHPLPCLTLEGEHVAEQRSPGPAQVIVRPCRGDRGVRGDIGVSIDLSVRVIHRHPDLLPAVLEHEDLLNARQGGEFGSSVGPSVNDCAGTGGAEPAEGAGVLRGEDDDFAAAVSGSRQRRGHGVGGVGGRLGEGGVHRPGGGNITEAGAE